MKRLSNTLKKCKFFRKNAFDDAGRVSPTLVRLYRLPRLSSSIQTTYAT